MSHVFESDLAHLPSVAKVQQLAVVRLPAARTGPSTAPRDTPWWQRKQKQIPPVQLAGHRPYLQLEAVSWWCVLERSLTSQQVRAASWTPPGSDPASDLPGCTFDKLAVPSNSSSSHRCAACKVLLQYREHLIA